MNETSFCLSWSVYSLHHSTCGFFAWVGNYLCYKITSSPLLRSDVLIGAPRANMSSDNIVERGAVYSCPWNSFTTCQQLQFDNKGTRRAWYFFTLNPPLACLKTVHHCFRYPLSVWPSTAPSLHQWKPLRTYILIPDHSSTSSLQQAYFRLDTVGSVSKHVSVVSCQDTFRNVFWSRMCVDSSVCRQTPVSLSSVYPFCKHLSPALIIILQLIASLWLWKVRETEHHGVFTVSL